jgi:hypothetical protein
MKREDHIQFMGWPNCIRLSNADVEIVIATDIGLRILRFGFIESENIFYLSPEDLGKRNGDAWRIYGGHRLWVAPETVPYYPDNDAVSFRFENETLIVTQPIEHVTGMMKEMEVTLSSDSNELKILHRLVNKNNHPVNCSAWGLSALAPGGKAIIPQEPFGDGDAFLLPVRSLALWGYTRMDDPRWTWGNKYIQAKQDPAIRGEQKLGVFNKQGWAAYCLGNNILIKVFAFDQAADYPDYGSNTEIYFNDLFLEIETLGPLMHLPPHATTEHIEYWHLSKGLVEDAEDSIDRQIAPLAVSFRNRKFPAP